jgi:hypothetical protein
MFVMISVMYICDIYVISFVCADGIQKINKKVHTGHFVECCTRQRGALPSVQAITLGKEPRPGHRHKFFAECQRHYTRQRSTLCRVPDLALGEEPDMGTLPDGFFTECLRWHSTKMDPLPSVAGQTLGKDNYSAECPQGHSAKPLSPSPGTVTAAFLCRVLSGTRQTSLSSVREKTLGKEGFADALCVEPSLPSVTLGKGFAECFCGFAERFGHSAKPANPAVYVLI